MLLLHMQEIVFVDSQEGLLSSRGGGGGADILAPGLQERTYTVRLRIINNGHNARLMHDHVTVISFTLITKLAHPILCVLV